MKILVVDDHPIVISGISLLLADEASVDMRSARSATEGWQMYTADRPDVAVVDINLPDFSGFDLVQRIVAADAAARIIVFSMNDDPLFAQRALECGALGYVSKNDDPAGFRTALDEVSAGRRYLSPAIAARVKDVRKSQTAAPDLLNRREQDILRLLAKGRSMQEIADLIGVSYKTVAGTCAAMRQKLDARTPAELIRIALERGYV